MHVSRDLSLQGTLHPAGCSLFFVPITPVTRALETRLLRDLRAAEDAWVPPSESRREGVED